MLEQFKVPKDIAVKIKEGNLRDVVTEVFRQMGVPEDDCHIGADVLVKADMRGVETHGVSNMLRSYVNGFRDGSINPTPTMQVLRETPATANVDADRGLGVIMTPKAMDMAIEKAKATGVGMVTIRNGRHLGMASYHAMMALEHDMIGVCMTSCPPSVLPTFGAEPRLGTNPIALAAPAGQEPPFVFDAATSTVAGNKLGLARRLGNDLMGGWVADNDGVPIMESVEPPLPGHASQGRASSFLLPVGGTREMGSHKGYGLSCIVDILGGILSGGGYGFSPGRPNFGHYVAAYSVEAFMDTAEFKRTMDEWIRMLESTKPAKGQERVVYPGRLEAEEQQIREAEGIPFHPEVVDWFKEICGELSIPYRLTDA